MDVIEDLTVPQFSPAVPYHAKCLHLFLNTNIHWIAQKDL